MELFQKLWCTTGRIPLSNSDEAYITLVPPFWMQKSLTPHIYKITFGVWQYLIFAETLHKLSSLIHLLLLIHRHMRHMCHGEKSCFLGDGHPTCNRNPYNGYINPYYWVDDNPLLYGNNGSLDLGTYIGIFSNLAKFAHQAFRSLKSAKGLKNPANVFEAMISCLIGINGRFWFP